jgi:hypothetical protein
LAEKWFEARGKSLNWHKEDSQTARRRNALSSRKGHYLNTARALQALANITKDAETKRKAQGDAKYFFHRYHMIVKDKVK